MPLQNKIEQQINDIKKIVRKQYPDLFDIAKNGQSVWLEKAYMESLLELFVTLLSTCQQELIQEVVRMVEGKKRVWPVDFNCQHYHMGYNTALSDIIAEFKKVTP